MTPELPVKGKFAQWLVAAAVRIDHLNDWPLTKPFGSLDSDLPTDSTLLFENSANGLLTSHDGVLQVAASSNGHTPEVASNLPATEDDAGTPVHLDVGEGPQPIVTSLEVKKAGLSPVATPPAGEGDTVGRIVDEAATALEPAISHKARTPLPADRETHYSEGALSAVVDGLEVLVAGMPIVTEARAGSRFNYLWVRSGPYQYAEGKVTSAAEKIRKTNNGRMPEDAVKQLRLLGQAYLTREISKEKFERLLGLLISGKTVGIEGAELQFFAVAREALVVKGKTQKPRNVFYRVPGLKFGILESGQPASGFEPANLRKHSDLDELVGNLVLLGDYLRFNAEIYLTERRLAEINRSGRKVYYRHNKEYGATQKKTDVDERRCAFAATFLLQCAQTISGQFGQGWIRSDVFKQLCTIGNLYAGKKINERKLIRLGERLCRNGRARLPKPWEVLEVDNSDLPEGEDLTTLRLGNLLTFGLENSGLFINVKPDTYESMLDAVHGHEKPLRKALPKFEAVATWAKESKFTPIALASIQYRLAVNLSYILSPITSLTETIRATKPNGVVTFAPNFLELTATEISELVIYSGLTPNEGAVTRVIEIVQNLENYKLYLVCSIAAELMKKHPKLVNRVKAGQLDFSGTVAEFIKSNLDSPRYLEQMLTIHAYSDLIRRFGESHTLHDEFLGKLISLADQFFVYQAGAGELTEIERKTMDKLMEGEEKRASLRVK